MSNFFALLVGINHYHPSSKVTSLNGCRNDILTWNDYLESHFPKEKRQIVTLFNEDATYQNVVKQFGNEFLGKAEKGDVVLFAYSGHGSRERSAEQFDKYYPEGIQETLVLFESRNPGGLDLSDKELAVLIERIAVKGVHVVMSLDSCHSGSATRNLEDITLGAVRQYTGRSDARPFESYLDGDFIKKGNGFYLPNSRHILLAACDRTEKAWELTNNHGLFSYSMMEVLKQGNGNLTYADLYSQCKIQMSRISNSQHPQFEPNGFFNAQEGFLGLGGAKEGVPLYVFFEDGIWQVNKGAIHGLPTDFQNPVQFEIVQNGIPTGLMKSKIVGLEATSLTKPDFMLNQNQTYQAHYGGLESRKEGIELVVDNISTGFIYDALNQFKPIYFDLIENLPNADYALKVTSETITLTQKSDDKILRTLEGNNWDLLFNDAFDKLELISRWEKLVEIDNQNSKISHNDIELVLSELDKNGNVLRKTSDKEVIIDINRINGKEEAVPFRLEVKNKNSTATRHCALFYASGSYGFFPMGFNEPIIKQSTAIALERQNNGDKYEFKLNGKSESTDIFKLFVSNTQISAVGLHQNGFAIGEKVKFSLEERSDRSVLAKEKDVSGFEFDSNAIPEDMNDWYCITMKVKCVAKESEVGLKDASLLGGFIKIKSHPFFKAGLGIASSNSGSRNIESMSIISEMADFSGVELLNFGSNSRDISSMNMLELTDMTNEESLITDPLKIEIAANLKQDVDKEESLLALTYDGEFLLPIGFSETLAKGNALVSITNIPDFIDVRRRSLGKALKLCFLKLVLSKENVQYLRWVDYSGSKAERLSEGLQNKIVESKNIVLLLHGIIGDTQEMAESFRELIITEKDKSKPIDLVLTFDYENLNTPIEETAGKLDEMLKEAGIHFSSGKKITMVVHSMGGLVARHFIENLGGNKVVKQLIMAGTPNGGSAIAKILSDRDYAIPFLTLLINLPWGIPFAASMLAILKGSQSLTNSLSQMGMAKDYLDNLNRSPDPGLQYTVIAGHLDKFMDINPDQHKLLDKAINLGGKFFYGDLPNDLAVSIESIRSVPKGRDPKLEIFEVACHHLNYFTVKESIDIIKEKLSIVN